MQIWELKRMRTNETFERAVQRHDQQVAELGLRIWVGSEPTFTDREAQTPAWLNSALGEGKEERAQELLRHLSERMPGGLLLRSVGRLYPGEKTPRWNMGLLRRRNGVPMWLGPPDPLLVTTPHPGCLPGIATLVAALSDAFVRQGWSVQYMDACEPDGLPENKLSIQMGDEDKPSLSFLVRALESGGAAGPAGTNCWAIEFPALDSVADFLTALSYIERAALACGLSTLVLAGAAPPVDASLELTTITPDPAVIEVNMAPSETCTEFLWRSRQVYAAAAAQGLSPYRLYFNGQVADPGGAGQITFGGPTPESSPFVRDSGLLPKLVRFLNRHPALSYLFAHDFVGSCGQSVRPDERGADAFDDLVLALALLEREPNVSPEHLWKSLTSFLCDAVGNSHRAETNIEKLWNPFLPGRGCLGLVEFRSLRMQHTPERATAIACLLRSVIAMLATRAYDLPLIDWGRTLHDRFSLPFYLGADLDAVFGELAAAELGLDPPIKEVLLQNEFRFFGKLDLPFGTLELWRGLEFWPLVGDAASPEQSGSSRMVDASTTRIEVRWRPSQFDPEPKTTAAEWLDWDLYAGDTCLPLRYERDRDGRELKVFGVRYTSFVPRAGLHPLLQVQSPLTLTLRHGIDQTQYVFKLHEWHPAGQAYPGLPKDLHDARDRRAERMTVVAEDRPQRSPVGEPSTGLPQSGPGLTPYCLDLRHGSPGRQSAGSDRLPGAPTTDPLR
jgi:uncharacterized protein (DUF2126 family)